MGLRGVGSSCKRGRPGRRERRAGPMLWGMATSSERLGCLPNRSARRRLGTVATRLILKKERSSVWNGAHFITSQASPRFIAGEVRWHRRLFTLGLPSATWPATRVRYCRQRFGEQMGACLGSGGRDSTGNRTSERSERCLPMQLVRWGRFRLRPTPPECPPVSVRLGGRLSALGWVQYISRSVPFPFRADSGMKPILRTVRNNRKSR